MNKIYETINKRVRDCVDGAAWSAIHGSVCTSTWASTHSEVYSSVETSVQKTILRSRNSVYAFVNFRLAQYDFKK